VTRRLPRPCLSCGAITHNATRCSRCGGDRTPTNHGYGNSERLRRAAVVDQWREQRGEVCPGWGRRAHAVVPPNRLSADHVRAVASGGAQRGRLAVLCLECNGRKGQR
jgi:5-methylcytosine-specific restriction protein A